MNLLTFDIEDWYNCDFISGDFNWDKHEVRIYQGVDRILTELEKRNQKGTFFLPWLDCGKTSRCDSFYSKARASYRLSFLPA